MKSKKRPGSQLVPTAVIANPYNTSDYLPTSFTRNKIVYYGKLSPQKGSFELLAFLRRLWEAGFPHALHIIGGTDIVFHPEMKTMGQLVKEQYGRYMERKLLQMHGKIDPAFIEHALTDAHVIIVPSIVDNMPYVVMEAMSLGKIVLASLQGGQREMLENGVSGFLFDHNKKDSFASQLNKILSLTDHEIQQIGKNARERVQRLYSFETVFSQKQAFLQNLVLQEVPSNHFPFLHQENPVPLVQLISTPLLLSVVIPFYNMGRYIEECIRSVKTASYRPIEIIIINDGSTDAASLEKLEQLSIHDDITIIHRKNCGLADTRNYGAAAARGEFLAFLDADDKVEPSYYEKAITALNKNENVFFAGAWTQYFENSRALWPTFTPQPPYCWRITLLTAAVLFIKEQRF